MRHISDTVAGGTLLEYHCQVPPKSRCNSHSAPHLILLPVIYTATTCTQSFSLSCSNNFIAFQENLTGHKQGEGGGGAKLIRSRASILRWGLFCPLSTQNLTVNIILSRQHSWVSYRLRWHVMSCHFTSRHATPRHVPVPTLHRNSLPRFSKQKISPLPCQHRQRFPRKIGTYGVTSQNKPVFRVPVVAAPNLRAHDISRSH